MGQINGYNASPGAGITRISFSEEDREARDYLMAEINRLGLSVKIDGAGNIRALYPGETDLPTVMIGSHIDTVYQGGEYDGLAGTICALEVIRALAENNRSLKRGVELIIFSEEEGSNFGITMFGSSILTGQYDVQALKEIYNSKGQSAYDVMEQFGFPARTIGQDLLGSDEVYAMMELHIEQAGVLEYEGKQVGIVENIAGLTVLKIRIEGQANHAGATPMHLRRDPMVAAASLILELENEVKPNAMKPNAMGTTVATVGKIHCTPNISNVIPSAVEIYIDLRDVEEDGIYRVIEFVNHKIREMETRLGVNNEPLYRISMEQVAQTKPVKLSNQVLGVLERNAVKSGMGYRKMNSGAVHDAAIVASKTQVGMIFIPSKEGRSHCAEEYSRPEDILAGCQLLLDSVVDLASQD
jgi:hydantoinase/carbamoylase family amidase